MRTQCTYTLKRPAHDRRMLTHLTEINYKAQHNTTAAYLAGQGGSHGRCRRVLLATHRHHHGCASRCTKSNAITYSPMHVYCHVRPTCADI